MKKLYLTPIAKVIEVDNTEVIAGSGEITMDPNGTGGNAGGNSTPSTTDPSDADSYRSNLWD